MSRSLNGFQLPIFCLEIDAESGLTGSGLKVVGELGGRGVKECSSHVEVKFFHICR